MKLEGFKEKLGETWGTKSYVNSFVYIGFGKKYIGFGKALT